MRMAPDRPTRVAADLLDAATVEGTRQSRSAKQQLDHWTRVGQAVSTRSTAAGRRVEAALAGRLPLAALSSDERVVVEAEFDATISETAARISFGRVLRSQGLTTVALDENGTLIRYHPDGSSSPLS